LRDALPTLRGTGAELVVIGSGRPWHAAAFREEEKVDFPLLVDPDLQAYAAAALQRSKTALLKPKVLARGAAAFKQGFRQTSTKGDPWQNGGVFVIAQGGRVLYEQRSDGPGDHAPVDDVLAALAPAPA
jgi:peroxiredoxin